MYAVLCHPIAFFIFLQTLPVNSNFCTRWLIVDLACACLMFLRKLSLNCHRTTGLEKRFHKKLMLLHAAQHLAKCVLFIQLYTPDIPASSSTTFFYFSYMPFHSEKHVSSIGCCGTCNILNLHIKQRWWGRRNLPNCEQYECSKSMMRNEVLNSKLHGNCW